MLTRVAPPAGGDWDFVYNGNLGTAAGSFALQRLTNPFGGSISYSYDYVNFLPPTVGQPAATAVTQKTAAGDTWRYAYVPACQSGTHDTTTVTLADSVGQIVYKHFGYCSVGAGSVWKIGLLHQKQHGSEQTETYSWSPQAISNESTARPGYASLDTQIYRPLLAERQISRDGVLQCPLAIYPRGSSARERYPH